MSAIPSFVSCREPLAPRTTLKVGGEAEYFARVATIEELRSVIEWATSVGVAWRVIGGGSNILVSDAGVSGLVIEVVFCEQSSQLEGDVVLATFGAGLPFDDCVDQTVTNAWWGLENLSHIPGTVGATPIQNVGAYGVEVSDIIESVMVFDVKTMAVTNIPAADCGFGYRTSRFKTTDVGRYIVLSVTFRLHCNAQPQLAYKDLAYLSEKADVTPREIREAVIAIRATKFPDWTVVGTAGSFFKNPIIPTPQAQELCKQFPDIPVYPLDEQSVKVSLGYILDKVCQLRGYQLENVGLYEQQALVLVVTSGATAQMIDDFAQYVTVKVLGATGIKIEREVVSWS